MYRSHKIRLYPTTKQSIYFIKAAGCSRLAYNWCLFKWKYIYNSGGSPSIYALKKQFNSIKAIEFPFVYEVTKTACEGAFRNLNKAFNNFFNGTAKYPKFKKKGIHDSFYMSNDVFKLGNKYIIIPKLGKVRMAESLRFKGKILSATVSRTADLWFVSISMKIPDIVGCDKNQAHPAIGIDLGLNKLATLSDGTVFENHRTTKQHENRLRMLNKSLSRKKIGSNNYNKAKTKLARAHYKIMCIRQDALHKMTTCIANNYSDIYIEDLNNIGLLKNRRLSKSLSDASFGEIRRQLEYKSDKVCTVDRFFPSTKLCMNCGTLHDMPLNKRTFKCDCNNIEIDRDIHAAQNILRQGLSFKPVESEALVHKHSLMNETTDCEAGSLGG